MLRHKVRLVIAALTAVLSMPVVAAHSQTAFDQALGRSARIAAIAWKDIPGQHMLIDSRSPLTIPDLRAGGGEPVRIEAWLWMPDTAAGPVPVVILFNCGDVELKKKEGTYSEEFHRRGYAVLNVNGLAARVADVAVNPTTEVFKYRYATIVDALMSLKTLATDPRIDPKRIAIAGWTNGATSILGAAAEELRAAYVGSDARFAAVVPIQPVCSFATLGARFSPTPVLALLGENDDFAPPKPCEAYRQAATARGAAFEMVVYQGVAHNWDMDFALHYDATQTSLKDTCWLQTDLGDNAMRLGDGRVLPFLTPGLVDAVRPYLDACRTNGITEGGNAVIHRDALARIADFIGRSFASAD